MKHFFYILLLGVFFLNFKEQQEIKTITKAELKVLLKTEKIQLLDVRTPKEIEQGFIETAIFINYYDEDFFVKAVKQLDKNKAVYLYCKSGYRSGKASRVLQKEGYKVYNFIDGYNKWKKEN